MRSICEEEIPQLQDFRQRGRAGTERAHRAKRVDLGRHALGEQEIGKGGVDDGEAFVYERETLVDPFHRAADVAWTFSGDKGVEESEGFGLGAGGIEEGRAHHVHALDVEVLFRLGRGLAGCARGRDDSGLVQFPGHGVEDPCDAGIGDTAFEEGIGGQSAKRVVFDLVVDRRSTTVDEREVGVCWVWRDVEESEPEVDSIVGHSISVGVDAGGQDRMAEELDRLGESGARGSVVEGRLEGRFTVVIARGRGRKLSAGLEAVQWRGQVAVGSGAVGWIRSQVFF